MDMRPRESSPPWPMGPAGIRKRKGEAATPLVSAFAQGQSQATTWTCPGTSSRSGQEAPHSGPRTVRRSQWRH